MHRPKDITIVRVLLIVFMMGLFITGAAIFPLKGQVDIMNEYFGAGSWLNDISPGLAGWISKLHGGICDIHERNPFLFYCTDWVGFGCIAIGLFFIGAVIDPVKNIWVIQCGMIICLLSILTVFVCCYIRGFPFTWMLIDSCFGAGGFLILFPVYLITKQQTY